MARYRIGIDFGTTFSFVGFEQNGFLRPLIPTNETYGIPSIFYADQRQVLVGRDAERQARVRPANAVRSVKRQLDRKGPMLQAGDKTWEVQDIVQEIFTYLARQAEKLLRETYIMPFGRGDRMEAVITVPVKFPEPMRALIRRAASQVRLSNGSRLLVTGVIPEPVAAAIHYFGMGAQRNRNILVFDLGGGTLDLALVHARNASLRGSATIPYEVLDMEGDPQLGGDDWDAKISQWLTLEYEVQSGRELNDRNQVRFLEEARNLKITLSTEQEAFFTLDVRDDILDGTLERETFETMTSPLMNRVMECVNRLMGRHPDLTLDSVILTGGSSHMPMVYNAICARFPGVDVRRVDPEHAIAYGAARYAATLSWDELHQETHKETQMIDLIASHGYGIRYLVPDGRGGRMNRVVILIPRGSRLPASCQLRSFAREGEDFTILRVYETDRDCGLREQIPLEECRQVLETSIHMDRPLAGRAESQDTLSLTEDGILTVSSVNLTTKQSAQNQVQLTHIL